MGKKNMTDLLDIGFADTDVMMPSEVYLYRRDDELEDEANVLTPASKEFQQFINTVIPKVVISTEKVSDIKYDQFEEMKNQAAELQAEVQKLAAEIAQKEKLSEEARQKHEAEMRA